MLDNRKRQIRIIADAFREKCKVGRYGIIDLFKECERCGYKLVRYPMGDSADLGFALKKDNDIIVYTNSSSRLSREIFTLAHEIGHVVLHLNDVKSFIDDSMTIADRSDDEREREANYFAACLLMPVDEIDKFIDLELPDFEKNSISAMDIARMMSEFNVSYEMVLNRLESLSLIDSNKRIQLDTERNITRVGNLLRSIGGNAKLNICSEEIYLPYEYIEYVIYNYNHNAVPRETLEKVLSYYKLTFEDVIDRVIEPSEMQVDLDELMGGLED
ncbi:ImmA/IrrE family metallo-endopeptidase [Butyrivibrio sp. MC2013]|uniref:ImmA/IrrE family metallo-endopeptidase n=1 Tax=Butyrivibrio sp. MC2013 TaxID=1280686 RepID=UPI0003F9B36E|nr:ImmA/IrrE family metallo-endopeptidase [Butyrivibrio sp. MC2013]